MKKLILLIIFLCFAASTQAAKMEAPAPPGSGTFAELGGACFSGPLYVTEDTTAIVEVITKVSSGADDGRLQYPSSFSATSDVAIGQFSGTIRDGFIRFLNTPIPPGATITKAQLRLYAVSNNGYTVPWQVGFVDDINAAAPTDSATFISAKAARITPLSGGTRVGVASSQPYYFPVAESDADFVAAIQSLVDDVSWDSGDNALLLILNDNGAADGNQHNFHDFENSTGAEFFPALIVEYTTGGPECVEVLPGPFADINGVSGSWSVGSDSEAGFVDIKNANTFPPFGKYGLNIIDHVTHLSARDDSGASWLKRVYDQSIIGSFLGAYFLEGFDLSPANYTEVKNWLWSTDGYTAISPYEPLADDFDSIVTSGTLYTPTVSLVNDSERGVVFDYSTTEGDSTSNFDTRLDEYKKDTGITASATGWTVSAWVKFPATAVAIDGTTLELVSSITVEVGEDDVQFVGIQALYDTDGLLDEIQAIAVTLPATISTFTLVANPEADTWYNLSMVCDGTTGIDYRVSDSDGALLAIADESDLPLPEDFSAWSTSFYGIYPQSGTATGTPVIQGAIVGFRVDEFSFWTLKP
jgi:hypothetical protein